MLLKPDSKIYVVCMFGTIDRFRSNEKTIDKRIFLPTVIASSEREGEREGAYKWVVVTKQ